MRDHKNYSNKDREPIVDDWSMDSGSMSVDKDRQTAKQHRHVM